MVHALEEIRRILVPDGILIDLRPLADRWPVELTGRLGPQEIGRLTDLPLGLTDDEAANRAIQEGARRGWFVREIDCHFPFFYYWDSPGEMRGYIEDEWADFVQLDEQTFQDTHTAWEEAGTGCQVRVQMKMLLTRWRKT